MLQMMLCGAHDVGELSTAFSEVAQEFGAEPWFYQQGKIQHINSRTSRWADNSRATVKKVDICIFVMLDQYGDITWNHELQEALELGKPFLVLALESAWLRYNTILFSLTDPAAIKSEDDRLMVDLLRMMSSDHEITVTPFTYPTFKQKLRAELSDLFEQAVHLVEIRNHRAALLEVVGGTRPLRRDQVSQAIALATDEYEVNKLERKAALVRLASDGHRDRSLVMDVCRSHEQGVQRLGFDLLPSLMPIPLEEDAVRELAQIAANCGDVGIPRRFISSIVEIDPLMIDVAMEAIGSMEEGLRRRAFEGVEEHLDDVLREWGQQRMDQLLCICEGSSPVRAPWLVRLRELRARIGEQGSEKA